jgi:hypothetical protein
MPRSFIVGALLLTRLLRRIPARYTLAALILTVLVLPGASPTFGKGAISRVATRTNPSPTASGAEAAYPLNHALDATGGPTGTPPANYDFETAPTAVGTSPQNYDFATGDFTGWTTVGSPTIASDGPQGSYASLGSGASVTTAAFTVDVTAQVLTLKLKGLTTGSDQYKVSLLSGSGFATSTQLAFTTANDAWETQRYNAASWLGQPVKLKVERFLGTVGVDDVGLQSIDLPSWTVTGNPTRLTGGPTGAYVRTDGQLTSAAFTLATDAQQLSVAYKGDTAGAQFYLELLRGADFSQVVDLAGGTIVADQTRWKTSKAGVSLYAGETVKLRLRRWFGWMLFDTAGPTEVAVPGWKLHTVDAVVTGEDANGTYASPFKSGGTVYLRSSDIQSGVIDRTGQNDFHFFAVAYDIGTQTGSLLRVTWYKNTGENWVVFTDSANTPTGYRSKYFYVADFMGQVGYFVVQVTGGKVYSIADNVARQQLAEPFSQKVGLQVDTATGSFGYSVQDVSTAGSLPLVFSRYYVGHSDRLGSLGYRWSHSYDTKLVLTNDSDAGVVFGSGSEAFFDWNPTTQTFTAADARVHDTLVKNGDGTYTFTTTANLKYQFSAAGVLTSIKDLNTNTLSWTSRLARCAGTQGGGPDRRTVTATQNQNMGSAPVERRLREPRPGQCATAAAADGSGQLAARHTDENVLDRLDAARPSPAAIVRDCEPDMTSQTVDRWASGRGCSCA